jgi:hypothetical protein
MNRAGLERFGMAVRWIASHQVDQAGTVLALIFLNLLFDVPRSKLDTCGARFGNQARRATQIPDGVGGNA